MTIRTVHILIEGRVQGVGFRYWVQQQAGDRGLTGWVRNRRTGAVEAVFAGSAGEIDEMLGACRSGPSSARVDALYMIADVGDGTLGAFTTFEARATA